MKPAPVLWAALAGSLSLCGCGRYLYHSHTEPRDLSKDYSFQIAPAGPIAVVNGSPKARGVEEVLCQIGGWDILGSLHDFTESAVGSTRAALRKQGVRTDDGAERRLELWVHEATCQRGLASASLRVKTGSGLTREYRGQGTFRIAHATTAGFEGAMVKCIEQMLADRDVVAYLAR